MSPTISTQQHDKTATVQQSASPFGCQLQSQQQLMQELTGFWRVACQLTESTTTYAGAYWLSKGGSICYMLGYPAGLKAGAVVQPVVWPMVEGSEVYVRRHVVCQKVLPFIVSPPAGSCQACRKEKKRLRLSASIVEKPSIIPGCPGVRVALLHVHHRLGSDLSPDVSEFVFPV